MALTNEDLKALADLIKQQLEPIDNRLEKIESEVSSLKIGQHEINQIIKNFDKRISDTYELALDAWGKSTENRVWLEQIN